MRDEGIVRLTVLRIIQVRVGEMGYIVHGHARNHDEIDGLHQGIEW